MQSLLHLPICKSGKLLSFSFTCLLKKKDQIWVLLISPDLLTAGSSHSVAYLRRCPWPLWRSHFAHCNLKVPQDVFDWGNHFQWLSNRSNHHSESYSHSAYGSRSYEINSWLPRRNQAGFPNWAQWDRAPSLRAFGPDDDRKLLLSGIPTIPWTHPRITGTPTIYQKPQ